jgi:ABC-type nickel/cobalt efflux system permease component RcnA
MYKKYTICIINAICINPQITIITAGMTIVTITIGIIITITIGIIITITIGTVYIELIGADYKLKHKISFTVKKVRLIFIIYFYITIC